MSRRRKFEAVRPIVAISLDVSQSLRRGVPFETFQQKSAYAKAVEEAGGLPWWVGPTQSPETISELFSYAQAVVITGGDFDIAPEHYGAEHSVARIDSIKPERTSFEFALFAEAQKRKLPILGVCGGMQLINVALGGTLYQDLGEQHPDALEHEQPTSPEFSHHPLQLSGWLAQQLGPEALGANSTHHQAVQKLGTGLEAWAHSEDGVIEAFGNPEGRIVGVQWHPELMQDPRQAFFYRHLIAQCRN